jgi:hypothetical protein
VNGPPTGSPSHSRDQLGHRTRLDTLGNRERFDQLARAHVDVDGLVEDVDDTELDVVAAATRVVVVRRRVVVDTPFVVNCVAL